MLIYSSDLVVVCLNVDLPAVVREAEETHDKTARLSVFWAGFGKLLAVFLLQSVKISKFEY